jgi:hypothetical protein
VRRVAVAISLIAIPVALSAQKAIAPVGCSFDTLAHTDTLHLEFSLRAYRGDDAAPDAMLTYGLGEMIRPRFAPPPSIAQLLAPNTYNPARYKQGFTSVFGTMQFDLAPDGKVSGLKWFAPSLDAATDRALGAAMQGAVATNEPRDLALSIGLKKSQRIRVQFLASQDSSVRAPLARMRVPMLRIDSAGNGVHVIAGAGPAPREMFERAREAETQLEYTVDESGNMVKGTVQIVAAPMLDVAAYMLSSLRYTRWDPAFVGNCPVATRMRAVFGHPAHKP